MVLVMIIIFYTFEFIFKIFTFKLFYANVRLIDKAENIEFVNGTAEYIVEFVNVKWKIKIFHYKHFRNVRPLKVSVNGKLLEIVINSYGSITPEYNESMLGYFHINEKYEITGLVEFRNKHYQLINIAQRPVIILSEIKELVNIKTDKFTKQAKTLKQNTFNKPCKVKVIIGPYLYANLSENIGYFTEREKIKRIKILIENTFSRLNSIFYKLPWDIKIEFKVDHLIIVTPKMCLRGFKGPVYEIPLLSYCNSSSTAHDLLESFRQFQSNNIYCISAALLHQRQLINYVGFANEGTICDNRFNKRNLFLNLITRPLMMNYSLISLILAHEIGHLTNAKHDEFTTCKTNGSFNYIMDGSHKATVPEFSKCSIKDMLAYVTDNNYHVCFYDSWRLQYCGNGILEGSEECDCGMKHFDCPCCIRSTCRLLSYYDCSPFGRYGMCCDSNTCKWKPRSENITCSLNTDCVQPGFCTVNGCSSDNTVIFKVLCARNTKACTKSICYDSICSLWNLNEYPSHLISNATCQLYCYDSISGLHFSLSSLSQIPQLKSFNLSNISYIIGSRCMKPNEFCDYLGKCVKLEGTLTLVDMTLMLNPTFYRYLSIIIRHYFIVIIFGLLLIIVFSMCIFEGSYMIENKNIYRTIFHNVLNDKNVMSGLNYAYFKVYTRDGKIRKVYLKIENEMMSEEYVHLQDIRTYFNYLMRKQNYFPINGRLMEFESNEILNRLKYL